MVSRRLPNWYIFVELYMVSQSECKMNWKWSSEGHHINPEDMGVPLWTGSWRSDGGYAVSQYTQSGSARADTALTLLPCFTLHVRIYPSINLISATPSMPEETATTGLELRKMYRISREGCCKRFVEQLIWRQKGDSGLDGTFLNLQTLQQTRNKHNR